MTAQIIHKMVLEGRGSDRSSLRGISLERDGAHHIARRVALASCLDIRDLVVPLWPTAQIDLHVLNHLIGRDIFVVIQDAWSRVENPIVLRVIGLARKQVDDSSCEFSLKVNSQKPTYTSFMTPSQVESFSSFHPLRCCGYSLSSSSPTLHSTLTLLLLRSLSDYSLRPHVLHCELQQPDRRIARLSAC
jgi:hypothetical protein